MNYLTLRKGNCLFFVKINVQIRTDLCEMIYVHMICFGAIGKGNFITSNWRLFLETTFYVNFVCIQENQQTSKQ